LYYSLYLLTSLHGVITQEIITTTTTTTTSTAKTMADFTYVLLPWNRELQKQRVFHLAKKFSTFCGT
jgi:hypothetical protein